MNHLLLGCGFSIGTGTGNKIYKQVPVLKHHDEDIQCTGIISQLDTAFVNDIHLIDFLLTNVYLMT